MNEEGIPFRIVPESSRETRKVMATPSTITPTSSSADTTDCRGAITLPAKNMVINAMIVGNLPLQGAKLLVKIAISRSRGESMMRQPMTPAALHPKPIQIVSACFPQACAFLKWWSRLKATRGRYPKSSKRVNNGKKIAMAGFKKSLVGQGFTGSSPIYPSSRNIAKNKLVHL